MKLNQNDFTVLFMHYFKQAPDDNKIQHYHDWLMFYLDAEDDGAQAIIDRYPELAYDPKMNYEKIVQDKLNELKA